MPSLYSIAQYWHAKGEPFAVDLSKPACFGCRRPASHKDGLEPWERSTPEELQAELDEARLLHEAGRISDRALAIYEEARPRQIAVLIKGPDEKTIESRRRFHWNSAVLERAHLVDRSAWGLDGEQNLVPLCGLCHRFMPSFENGQEQAAIDYVLSGGCLAFFREYLAKAASWAG